MAKRKTQAKTADQDGQAGKNGEGGRPHAIVTAAMTLAAERDWRDIALSDIAAAAGLSLSDLLAAFPSKPAILDGFARDIDRRMLAGFEPEPDSGSARDRLFDVLMRRFDALDPYKPALAGILRAAWQDPLAGMAMGGTVFRAMGLALEAAGIASDGAVGTLRRKALGVLYAATLRDWLKDDSADKSRTMAALDGRLRRVEGWAKSLESLSLRRGRASQGEDGSRRG
jgi:AcrR family transcriptional regulator